ncbi:MAG TPA: hypothetical protein VER33_17505 [Polyangiaceae bacterium]|nr:hypothetical protein [Polyangiaceae bacterium]
MRDSLRHGGLAALIALGCSGTLSVDSNPPASSLAGAGGSAPSQDGQGGGSAPSHGGRSGAGNVASEPGALGSSCIPAATTAEAEGTPAEAEVRTFDRCQAGYSCDSRKRCVGTPDCEPTSAGGCVLYRSSGAGGAPSESTGASAGGASGTVLFQSGVTDIAADETRVYWIDYGSRDASGNHRNDGALMAAALDGSGATTLNAALKGPLTLALTSSHAYVSVDGAGPVGSRAWPQLFRVPLSGGAPELVQNQSTQEAAAYCCLVASGGDAIWTAHFTVFSMASSPDAVLRAGFPDRLLFLGSDGAYLYHTTTARPGVWRIGMDRVDGTDTSSFPTRATELVVSPVYPLAVHGELLYGVESVDSETGLLLARVPTSGGSWQRVRPLGAGGSVRNFRLVGNRYFWDESSPGPTGAGLSDWKRIRIMTAVLDSDEPPVQLIERAAPRLPARHVWAGTVEVLFWSDSRVLYRTPIDAAH